MKNIFKCLVFILIMTSGNIASAQEFFRLKESIGMPLRSRNYIYTKGTPYFLTDWSAGEVKQADGKIYKDMKLKYDQLEDELIFKDSKGEELGFAIPVVEFKLNYTLDGLPKTSLFRNGFAPFKGSTEKNYYEILHDGRIKLAKKNVKRIEQYREYNSASTTKSVIERIKYYTIINNVLTEFKRDNKSIQQVFGEKSVSVLDYITKNNLDFKKDNDLIKVFAFYETL
ncbi:hypothetical protein [Pedobacter sp. Leaf170]|uniref:hypothetical protein n=1 Tax=Pedobacter sp. Leaf170 TaxID=2876558 RepID=UPI001E5FE052|nr:hypothetical protein [Pedobacter sp. Leaf170]